MQQRIPAELKVRRRVGGMKESFLKSLLCWKRKVRNGSSILYIDYPYIINFNTGFSVYSMFYTYGCLEDRKKKLIQRERNYLLCSSGTIAVKCFIACSPTLIDTYIRPLVLPQQNLEMPQSTVLPSFQSIFLSFYPTLHSNQQLFYCFPSLSTTPLPPFSSFMHSIPPSFLYLVQLLSLP